MEKDKVQVDWIGPTNNAQRADGRSNKQVVKIDQTDFVQERKSQTLTLRKWLVWNSWQVYIWAKRSHPASIRDQLISR